MKIDYYFFFLLFLLNLLEIQSQFDGFKEIPDSLIAKSYHSLYTDYYHFFNDTDRSITYATAFIKKAYLENDSLNITTGYYMLTYHNDDKYFQFNDSLLKYASYLPSEKSNYFSWYAYQGKGSHYFDRRNFKEAFDSHMKALQHARQNDDKELENISTTNLGLLKERTGKNEEALVDFKKNYNYEFQKINKAEFIDSLAAKSFLNSICLLSNSFRLNKVYDSAQFFNRKVFEFSSMPGAERYMAHARINAAEVYFELNNYQNVIDSINKALPNLIEQNNAKNAAVAYYLRGSSRVRLGDLKGMEDLVSMDSIFNKIKDLHPSLRSGYSFLINHYRNQDNTRKQLYYVEQLLKFDSLVYDYSSHITDGIYTDERNRLVNTQEELTAKVNEISNRNNLIIIVSAILIVILLFEIIRRKRRNEKLLKEFKLKFDRIVAEKTAGEKEPRLQKNYEPNISKSLVDQLLFKIQDFESTKGFLDKEISANKMASDLGTNANYLGQVIKYKYGIGFRRYINNLRIKYVLNEIRQNRRILKYSIQAIAQEAGYNNAEPFSKAFKTKTGYYPSEFIAKMKNQ